MGLFGEMHCFRQVDHWNMVVMGLNGPHAAQDWGEADRGHPTAKSLTTWHCPGAKPHSVDNYCTVSEIEGMAINQA